MFEFSGSSSVEIGLSAYLDMPSCRLCLASYTKEEVKQNRI